MPEMDGPTTVRHIRKLIAESGQAHPVIACVTAYTDAQAQAIAIDAEMDAFYSKPIQNKKIQEIVAILSR